MSSTPRTDEASIEFLKRYQLWRSGEDVRTMTDAGILPAEITKHLNAVIESADVSAALIAELRAALKGFVSAEDSFRSNTGMPYPSGEGDDMSQAYSLAKAALAKTPESVGADLARLKEEISMGDYHWREAEKYNGMVTANNAKLRASVAERDARISELETTNRDQLDSLSFCKGEIAELQESLAVNRRSLAANANVSVKLNQEFARANEAEAQRDALILAGHELVKVICEEHHRDQPEVLVWDAAVKQSGNQPETPADAPKHSVAVIDSSFNSSAPEIVECIEASELAELRADRALERLIIRGFMESLPVNRAWLNPDIERMAKEYVAARKTGGLTP